MVSANRFNSFTGRSGLGKLRFRPNRVSVSQEKRHSGQEQKRTAIFAGYRRRDLEGFKG